MAMTWDAMFGALMLISKRRAKNTNFSPFTPPFPSSAWPPTGRRRATWAMGLPRRTQSVRGAGGAGRGRGRVRDEPSLCPETPVALVRVDDTYT